MLIPIIEVTLTNMHQFVDSGEKYPLKIYDLSFGKYDFKQIFKNGEIQIN